MKQTINVYQFRDAFKSSSDYKNRFSYDGLGILFDYLEEYEQSSDQELEFDMVGIACEWYEDDWESICSDYSIDLCVDDWDELDDDERKAAVIEWLNDRTMIAGETEAGDIVFCTSFYGGNHDTRKQTTGKKPQGRQFPPNVRRVLSVFFLV